MGTRTIIKGIFAVAASAAMALSCGDSLELGYSNPRENGGSESGTSGRTQSERSDMTLLLYSAGFNSLSGYLQDDIRDICEGYLPEGDYLYTNNLLILAHHSDVRYDIKKSPCLIKVFRDRISHEVVLDTVKIWPVETIAVDTETLTDVLEYVRTNYKSKGYGMIFSSHASGWLPPGFFASSKVFPSSGSGGKGGPQKSIGQDAGTDAEMDVKDFAAAIPFRLDYIIFDACLVGGIEVAYELKDVCDRLVFSSEEILADGMVYTDIVRRLLEENPANLTGVAEDYFYHYNSMTGWQQSGLISTVRCSGLDALADACAMIYTNHRGQIPAIPASQVQKLNYNDPSYFYDLRDALEQLGLSDTEKEALDKALEECVEYSAHTEYFFKGKSYGYRIETFCGLSTYLPSAVSITNTRERLNEYYKGYKWNQATHWISD